MNNTSSTLTMLLCAALTLSGTKAGASEPVMSYAQAINHKLAQSKPPSKKWDKAERCTLSITLTPMGYVQKLEFTFCADETKVKMMEILTKAQPLPKPPTEAWATMKITFAGGA